MSTTIVSTKTAGRPDQLPILPETRPAEPLVQCGVLYLGSAPPTVSRHGFDSIQEPFSHRYPVDGTNTTRGIDAVLSVYDNGIQLEFTRQPQVAVFFPITSLVYSASVRFSIIENDYTKPTSNIGWRFMPLDALTTDENKHPPLFCAVTQRTQILPGHECHCFITKNTDAAFALVRTISQVYANVKPGTKCLKSPIFYQLDHLGKRLDELAGTIYLSPANGDESQLKRTNPMRLKSESTARKYLCDSRLGGFYYRTDTSLVEQWQLWDDNDLVGSRPHPPDSPFGLHEGLYHDDTTQEIQRYLRHMENEEQHPCSCSCSNTSSDSSSSSCSNSSGARSTERSRRPHRRRRSNKQKLTDDTDEFYGSFSQLQASSFEPVPKPSQSDKKKTRKKPIIIEKVLPQPTTTTIPVLNPKAPKQQKPPASSNSTGKIDINYIPSSELPSFSYQLNKRGEKITKEGNRIIFMDVVRPNTNKNPTGPTSYIPLKSRSRSHRRRSPKRIPVIDLQSIEKLFDRKKSKSQQRRTSMSTDNNSKDHSDHRNQLATTDMLEILDAFFEDQHGRKTKLKQHEIQSFLEHFELFEDKEQTPRKTSVKSLTDSSKSEIRYRRSRSSVATGPSPKHIKAPSVPSLSPSQTSSPDKQKPSTPPVLTDEKLNEYVSDIYGTARSTHSTTPSSNNQELQAINQAAAVNAAYMSAFRYMHSSINPNYLQEYRNAY